MRPTYSRSNININDELNSDIITDEEYFRRINLINRQSKKNPDATDSDQLTESSVDPKILWQMLKSGDTKQAPWALSKQRDHAHVD